jgi:2-methylcitrate dehydratase PrpD
LYASHVGREAFDAERLSRGLGQEWEAARIAFKPYPVCHFSHASMDAALHLRQQYDLDPQAIVAGEVLVPEAIVPVVCEPLADKQAPTSTYGALFSLPFCVASNLLYGHARLDSFGETALRDQKVLETAAKIGYQVEPWPEFPQTFPGGLRLRLRDGQTIEWREPINRGHPDNPLRTDEVRAKFRDNAQRVLPAARLDAIMATLDQLDALPRVAELTRLCVTA